MVPVRAFVHPGLERKPANGRPVQPFRDAQEAWFWTMAALVARRDGASGLPGSRTNRPCEPDDVVRCLDLLYQRRKIDLLHARVLRAWGERGVAPDGRYPAERTEARLWQEALDRLEWPLRIRGIIVKENIP